MDPNCIPFPGGGELPDPELEETYKIEVKVDNPCHSEQAAKAVSSDFRNKITNLVWEVFGESENFNIEIGDDDLNDPELDGTCFRSESGDYVTYIITLNSEALGSASKEYVMATIFHELLHAYLGYLELMGQNNLDDHELMADKYVAELRDALMEHFDISSKEAEDLSWGGLQFTSAYDRHLNKNRVIQNNFDHKNGTKGTNCN